MRLMCPGCGEWCDVEVDRPASLMCEECRPADEARQRELVRWLRGKGAAWRSGRRRRRERPTQ